MALAVFSGDLNPDPDAAAEELRRAGYTVHRLPPNFMSAFDAYRKSRSATSAKRDVRNVGG
jgi:transposase